MLALILVSFSWPGIQPAADDSKNGKLEAYPARNVSTKDTAAL